MTKCPYSIGYYQNDAIKNEFEITASCHSLRCPHCRKIRLNQIRDRINLNFKNRSFRMWTLTVRNHESIDDKDITKFWNRLRTQLRHLGIKNYRYCWVKELTKKQCRHIHIIIDDLPISQSQLQDLWYKATEQTSFIVDTGYPRFKIDNPAGYLSKYITKSVDGLDYKEKVYQFSYNCLKLAPYKPDQPLRYNALSFDEQTARYDALIDRISNFNDILDRKTRTILFRYLGQTKL